VISIVIPVFNEEKVLLRLCDRLSQVIRNMDVPVEIIFVDDGSTDQSFDIIMNLCKKNENYKILQFSRNFGHQAAILAGMQYAVGEAVITMDADLQHPPELIPELVKRWKEGYDIVFTCRKSTADISIVKKITSKLFYKIINRLADIDLPEGTADFRLLDRKVVDAFRTFNESRLFLRGIVSWMGYRRIGLPYEAPGRAGGSSKYSFYRMLRFAVDGIASFSSIPLYISALIGVAVSLLGFIYAVFVIYSWSFTHRVIEGWTSLMVVLLFISGVQLISLGVLGVYLGRIYDEAKRRPSYLIRRKFGFNK
jgi:glycosyltransferase involved in cell wall biosynthesis